MRTSALLLVSMSVAPVAAQQLRHVGPHFPFCAAYDSVRQRVVVPGSHADSGSFSREWDGVAWHLGADIGAAAGSLAYYDPTQDRLVTVYQNDPFVPSPTPFQFSVRSGGAWQVLPGNGGPSNRLGSGMAYDEAHGRLVVFGGYDVLTGTNRNDTWTFDGAAWALLPTPMAPSIRVYPAMAYDSVRARVVLFGGVDTTNLADTWEWDGTTWAAVLAPAQPPARQLAKMVFDSARGRMVLCGGFTSAPMPQDCWEYDGATWQTQPAPPLPSDASVRCLVFDAARGETLLIGYSDPLGHDGSMYAWDGTAWASRPGLGLIPQWDYGQTVARSPGGTTVLRFASRAPAGGSGGVLSAWDGSDWNVLATAGPASRTFASMWSMAGGTFLFGGTSTPSFQGYNDLWRWNGTAWSQLAPATSPSARWQSGVAVLPAPGRALLFGGAAPASLGDTWLYDGTNWQNLTIGAQPPPRRMPAMAYDPLRNRVVMFGGIFDGPLGEVDRQDTWEHDGTSWQLIATGGIVPPSSGTMTFDPARQRIVYAERLSHLGPYTFWDYDGVAWSQFAVQGDANSPLPVIGIDPRAMIGPNGRLTIVDASEVIELIAAPASADIYGATCAIAGPVLTAATLPVLGDATFAAEFALAPANGVVALAGGIQAASMPLFGCTLLVSPDVVLAAVADGRGYARTPLPIPNLPALTGAELFFQGAALDPATPFGLTLSRGLHITIGD